MINNKYDTIQCVECFFTILLLLFPISLYGKSGFIVTVALKVWNAPCILLESGKWVCYFIQFKDWNRPYSRFFRVGPKIIKRFWLKIKTNTNFKLFFLLAQVSVCNIWLIPPLRVTYLLLLVSKFKVYGKCLIMCLNIEMGYLGGVTLKKNLISIGLTGSGLFRHANDVMLQFCIFWP